MQKSSPTGPKRTREATTTAAIPSTPVPLFRKPVSRPAPLVKKK